MSEQPTTLGRFRPITDAPVGYYWLAAGLVAAVTVALVIGNLSDQPFKTAAVALAVFYEFGLFGAITLTGSSG